MMLLVSNPRIEAGTVTGFVETSQVALTILKVLGLDPSDLDAVGKEGPPILPGLHLEQVALIVGGWATAGRPHVELFRYREQWRAATATTGQARSNAGPVVFVQSSSSISSTIVRVSTRGRRHRGTHGNLRALQ